MRVISLNVRGLRNAFKKGFSKWLTEYDPDVLLIQETWTGDVASLLPDYYVLEYPGFPSHRSGVAIVSKTPLEWIELPPLVEREYGRLVAGRTQGMHIVNCYGFTGVGNKSIPSKHAHPWKVEFLNKFSKFTQTLSGKGICGGDLNLALLDIDVYHMRPYRILRHAALERNPIKELLDLGYRDLYREHHPETRNYTWYARGTMGWRLDYLFGRVATKSADFTSALAFSDHHGVVVDLV